MEIITTLINTFLLLALFWYQKNKNKVLVDRINEQSNLLLETKDVVINQAQAIESQKKVVDTALEYTKAFDIKKIESIIMRETELEFKTLIKDQEEKLIKKQQTIEKFSEEIMKNVEGMINDYAIPLSMELLAMLFLKEPKEREKVLSNLPNNIRKTLKESLDDFDNKRPRRQFKVLTGNEEINKK